MIKLVSAINGLWLAGLVLQPLLVLVLVCRGVWKRFPFFVAYSSFSLLETAVGYSVLHNPKAYLFTYLVGESISVVLGLAVVYEIFTNLFRPHLALRKVARMVLRLVIILLVVLALAVLYARTPIDRSNFLSALTVAEEAARIVEVGLIVFLFLSSSAFGLHWRQHTFGIAIGLGGFTAVKLVVVTMIPHVGSAAAALNLAVVLSFDLSLLVWMGYLLIPERVAAHAELPQRAQLEQWNQAMMELISQ